MEIPAPAFKSVLNSGRRVLGMAVESASPLIAELCAGSALDWIMIDAEHGPNDVPTIMAQLQALGGYPTAAVVRPTVGDTHMIKQLLDVGVRGLLIPMVESAEQAEGLVQAVRYGPRGVRGVGAAVSRASRWNRIPDYLARADDDVTLLVQIETAAGIQNVGSIADVEGVDGLFFGPADLAASMGYLGDPTNENVMSAIETAIKTGVSRGKPCGVGSFNEVACTRYFAAGATYGLVGSDVSCLVKASDGLVTTFAAL
jgi:4-hydroxy-2-oxoheptanedioate aldolase